MNWEMFVESSCFVIKLLSRANLKKKEKYQSRKKKRGKSQQRFDHLENIINPSITKQSASSGESISVEKRL